MNSELSTFNFLTHNIRVVTIDGDPWFDTRTVMKPIGLKGYPSNYLQRLNCNEKKVITREHFASELFLHAPLC